MSQDASLNCFVRRHYLWACSVPPVVALIACAHPGPAAPLDELGGLVSSLVSRFGFAAVALLGTGLGL